MSYNYNYSSGRLVNNRLNYLAGNGNATHFGPVQSANNYMYNAIGNLTADNQAHVSGINWSVYGKIQSLTDSAGSVTYNYNTAQQRISKVIGGLTTWYVRDAQGNTLALYDNKASQTNWREQHLYGSSRLGLWNPNVNLATNNASTVWDTIGKKSYELSNHLGNVMATITDARTSHSGYYTPNIIASQDYYAFGALMPGRASSSSTYRYGFNGKENDNEIKGVGNQQDYGMRIYDPRINRFLSVDPLARKYPELAPYQFAGNMPVRYVDLDGTEPANNPKTPGDAEKNGMGIITGIAVDASEHNFHKNRNTDNIQLLGKTLVKKLTGTVSDQSGLYISDTDPGPAKTFNEYVTKGPVFIVNESNATKVKDYEAFVVNTLLQNFISGKGPENYNFPENGIISSKFLQSDILKQALSDFNSGKVIKARQYAFGLGTLVKDTYRNGTIFNITGLTGSGTITITPTLEGVKIQIFNVTSLTSGTFGKEFFGKENYPKSYVRETEKITPFGNISQTYNLFIPSADFDKYLKK